MQCEKCGETVDAAKAFCPGCGSPLVAEEKRTHVSEFDASAGTVQYGNTMFNKMLSDLGLNISDVKGAQSNQKVDVRPEMVPPAASAKAHDREKPPGNGKKWLIVGIGAVFLLGAVVVAIAAFILIYLSWDQLSF